MKFVYSEDFFRKQDAFFKSSGITPDMILSKKEIDAIKEMNKILTPNENEIEIEWKRPRFKNGFYKGKKKPTYTFLKANRKPPKWKEMQEKDSQIIIGVLNKITPNNWESLGNKIINTVKLNNRIEDSVEIFYKKCLKESYYCEIYVKLCKLISEEIPEFGDLIIEKIKIESDEFINCATKQNIGLASMIAKMVSCSFLKKTEVHSFLNYLLDNITSSRNCGQHDSDQIHLKVQFFCEFVRYGGGKCMYDKVHFRRILPTLKQIRSNLKDFKVKFMIDDIIELEENDWENIRRAKESLEAKTKEDSRTSFNQSKKKAISPEEVKDIILQTLKEYDSVRSNEELLLSLDHYKKIYLNYNQIPKQIPKVVLDWCLEKNESQIRMCCDFLNFLSEESTIETKNIKDEISQIEEFKEDIKLDVPKIDDILDILKSKLIY